MIEESFRLDDDFNKIISDTLKDEGIDKVDKIETISTGWTNMVFEAYTDKGNYFFRFPRDKFWARTIVKDYEFAKYIHGKTKYETSNLNLGFDNRRPFTYHKKIKGVPLADRIDKLSPEKIKQVTNQIAEFMFELHNIEFKPNEVFSVINIGTNLNDFINELLDLHVKPEDKVFWKSENFNMRENDYCLVHGDLNTSNILLDENDNVSAIIDFGFGGFGNKYFDISRVLSRSYPESFKEELISSYSEFEKNDLSIPDVNKNITIWNNIDQAYINYMRTIGIYE